MRDVIKKILKEEDLDWLMGGYDKELAFEQFMNSQHITGTHFKKMSDTALFNMVDMFENSALLLESDAQELALLGEGMNDTGSSFDERRMAFDDFESYASFGQILDDVRTGFYFFGNFVKNYNVSLDEAIVIAKEYFKKRI